MIVGGLITEAGQQAAVLGAGARAITTSSVALWQ
jgi:glycerol-3-phosphate responsive antiterminator